MDTGTLTTFFGWMTAINFGMMLFTMFWIVVAKDFAIRMQQRFFDLTTDQVELVFYQYMAGYKIIVIVFNLVPYLALRFGMG